MIKLKTILFPTDFSEYADHAAPYATELAKKFGANIVMLHVVAYPVYPVTYEITIDVVSLRNELEAAAQKELTKRADKMAEGGVKVDMVLDSGTSFVEIIRTARKCEADLIVMATHGWGGVKHLLLGSTAERVVRKAPCPVLTVRSPEREFVLP